MLTALKYLVFMPLAALAFMLIFIPGGFVVMLCGDFSYCPVLFLLVILGLATALLSGVTLISIDLWAKVANGEIPTFVKATPYVLLAVSFGLAGYIGMNYK